MNSPPDPGSPISTSSSGDTPTEEIYSSTTTTTNYLSNLGSQIGAALSNATSGASKRRLPAGSSFAAGSARDPKSRRRGDNRQWEGAIVKEGSSTGGKKEKDELVDTALVEFLRKEIGDPFSEVSFKG
ncbi:hypothetical protein D9619_005241 [Psilocybe cf. subviscida]|uniref:Uncharacterized protein n=1 Tax=Psilocybe cf. subviscida TaxID=2480587 RepID=A0A8H5FBR1_9AGAR|nr:hypothetical protein D9619_005241 [Psilocybe cf. subviscida]